jgi:cystine transport system permease protein
MQESLQLVIDSAPYLLKGAVFTLQLSIGGMFFGLLLGFVLALMRLSPLLPVRWLARIYISIFRGTPLIAQLFMIYYGLPQFGIELDPIPAAMILSRSIPPLTPRKPCVRLSRLSIKGSGKPPPVSG